MPEMIGLTFIRVSGSSGELPMGHCTHTLQVAGTTWETTPMKGVTFHSVMNLRTHSPTLKLSAATWDGYSAGIFRNSF
jgi:hypothetical protein